MRFLNSALVFLAGAATVVVLVVLLNQGTVAPIAYGVLSDRMVVVRVLGAPGVRCDIAKVDESPQDVRIAAKCYPPPFSSGELSGVPLWFVVKLQDPLAGRSVIDGSGSPAERCSDQLCGAASG